MVDRSLQKLDNPLECWHESLESARNDPITHLSSDSLFVSTERALKAGLPVFLELALSQTDNPATAMIDGVVTSDPAPEGQSGFGVHFVRIDDAVRVWIEHTLTQHAPVLDAGFVPFGKELPKVPEEVSAVIEPLSALDDAKTDAHFRPEFDGDHAQIQDLDSLDLVEADALIDPSEDDAFSASLGFPASEAFPELGASTELQPPPPSEFGEDSFGLVHPEPTQTMGSLVQSSASQEPVLDEASPFSLESFEPTPFGPEPTGDIDPFNPMDSNEIPLDPISAEVVMDTGDRAILESPFFQTDSALPEPEIPKKTPPLGSDSRRMSTEDISDPPELHLHAAFQPALPDEDLDRTQGYDSEIAPGQFHDSSATVRSITDDTMQMPTPEAGPRGSFGIQDEGPTETLQMLAVNPAAAALEALAPANPNPPTSPQTPPTETLQMGAVDPFATEPSDEGVVQLPAGISREGSPVESTQRYVVERAPDAAQDPFQSTGSIDLGDLADEESLDAADFNDEAFDGMFVAPGQSVLDESSVSDVDEPSNDPFAEVAGVVPLVSHEEDALPSAAQEQPSVVLNAEALGLLGQPEDAMVLELGQPLGEFPFGQAESAEPSSPESFPPDPFLPEPSFPELSKVGTAPFTSLEQSAEEPPMLRQPADNSPIDPFSTSGSQDEAMIDPFVDSDAEFEIDDADEPLLSDLNLTPLPSAALDSAEPLFDPSPKSELPSGDWRVLESAAPTPAPPHGAPLSGDDPFGSDEDLEFDVDLDDFDDDLPVVVGSSQLIEESSADEEWTSS